MNKLVYILSTIALLLGSVHLFTTEPMAALETSNTLISEHIVAEFASWKAIYGKKYASP